VLQWLAGQCLLVKDLATARAVAPALPNGAQAVTLDGWLVSAEGVIHGGASDVAERGLLSRDREMAVLKATIETGEGLLAVMGQDRDRQRNDLAAVSRDIELRSREKSDAEIAVARLQKEQGARQEDVGRLAKESEDKRKALRRCRWRPPASGAAWRTWSVSWPR